MMKVKSLHLENFRGAVDLAFGDDTLSFDDQVNVFCGINGSGKTTILDAIYLMLSWLIAKRRSLNSPGQSIQELDVTWRKNGKKPYSKIEMGVRHRQSDYRWQHIKKRAGQIDQNLKSDYADASKLARFLYDHQPEQMPVLLYYPVTRAILDIPLKIRKKRQFDSLSCNDRDSKYADFRTFFEWFRDREDIENEKYRYASLSEADNQLEYVRLAIKKVIPEIEGLTVVRSPLHMQVIKNGRTLWIDQLSDGEKSLLALVADIARRLVIANQNQSINPLEGEGIILIDEADLHLHPTWQKTIVTRLSQTFPNCQFFFTTHSPLILSHLYPKNIFLLSEDSDRGICVTRPDSSYGKDCTRALEDIMGLDTTIPDSINRQLSEIYTLISDKEFKQAREKINKIRKENYNEPELDNAEMMVTMKERFSAE